MPEAAAEVTVAPLADIYMVSGTAQDGPTEFRGFIHITCQDRAGNMFKGQLEPDSARKMALQWLATAEAADQDAIVMTMLTRDIGLDTNTAAAFVSAMRKEREPSEDDVDDETVLKIVATSDDTRIESTIHLKEDGSEGM